MGDLCVIPVFTQSEQQPGLLHTGAASYYFVFSSVHPQPYMSISDFAFDMLDATHISVLKPNLYAMRMKG
jgi:hypothetical protein